MNYAHFFPYYAIQQCYFFLLLCHCNVSIMLKIMLGFHRNNHKPIAQLCDMSDMSPHAFMHMATWHSSSSAAVERVFSILKSSFDTDQNQSLKD